MPEAWLTTERAAAPVAFGPTHIFYLPGGGYVKHDDKAVFHFPLSAVDVQTGASQPLVLHVPFRGELTLPAKVEPDLKSPNNDCFHLNQPYSLAITDLHVDGPTLEITVGTEAQPEVLRFDLSKVELVRRALTAPSELEVARKRVKAIKNLEAKNKDGHTVLIEAVHGGDAA
jgi:hypothetical protein